MTVQELIEFLREFPPDTTVEVADTSVYDDTDRLSRDSWPVDWVGFRGGVIVIGAD